MKSTLCLLFAVLVACQRKEAPAVPGEPAPTLAERQTSYVATLAAHRERGWLVVRNPAGDRDQGDSLTWSAEAMAIDCTEAEKTLFSLEEQQARTGGYFERYDPLPDEYADNAVSRDGWVGVMYGYAVAISRCPALAPRLASSWQLARAAVGASTLLHPQGPQALVTPSFRFLLAAMDDLVADKDGEASEAERLGFELAAQLSVRSITATHAPCYPLHLALHEILMLRRAGLAISAAAHEELCAATASSGLVTWDWYCQRGGSTVLSWLEQYQPNRIVYAHQRCSWESENFAPGETAAPLDWLTLYDLYVNGG